MRAVLTMLGIIIGVAAVIIMIALGQGASNSVQARLAGLGTNMLTITPGSQGVPSGSGAVIQRFCSPRREPPPELTQVPRARHPHRDVSRARTPGRRYRAASSSGLAVVSIAGLHDAGPVLALMGVFGAARAFGGPSSQSLVPNSAFPHADFGNAIALSSSTLQVATIAGPGE